jgi:hypothetical protein
VPRIFICYRREDASGHAGRLRDALSARFGSKEVFLDHDAIGPGENFVQAMSRAIGSCEVFLAIIGNQWLSVTNRNGARRLDDPDDHVRREILEALGRDVRLIPILVEGADMPHAAELPEPLEPLAIRNAFALNDEEWESDVERLAAALRPETRRGPDVPMSSQELRVSRRPLVALLVAATVVAAIVALVYSGTTRTPDESSVASTAVAQVTLPAGGEAELGEGLFEILEAGIQPHSAGSTLTLRIRLTNHGRYDAGLFAEMFRVVVNAAATPPTNGVSEVVPAETAKDVTLTFELPPNTGTATLRISAANETADVPLDLSGRTGVTPEQDREKRRFGGSTKEARIDPARANMRLGDLTCALRSAVLRRYAHKFTLTVRLRVQNGGRYPVNVGDGQFRLVLDGSARAPVGGLNEVLSGETTRDCELLFDVPLDARQAVLRARFGDLVAEAPLQISQ